MAGHPQLWRPHPVFSIPLTYLRMKRYYLAITGQQAGNYNGWLFQSNIVQTSVKLVQELSPPQTASKDGERISLQGWILPEFLLLYAALHAYTDISGLLWRHSHRAELALIMDRLYRVLDPPTQVAFILPHHRSKIPQREYHRGEDRHSQTIPAWKTTEAHATSYVEEDTRHGSMGPARPRPRRFRMVPQPGCHRENYDTLTAPTVSHDVTHN